MSEKMGGGPNSMMFGLGNSNAKVYVPSTDGGIRFADVAGEDEAKDNLQEIVNYLHDPSKYKAIGASMPKGIPCWWALPEPARPCWQRQLRAKQCALLLHFRLGICRNVRGHGRFQGSQSVRPDKAKKPPASFSSMRVDAIGQKRSGGQYGGNDERGADPQPAF